MASKQINTLTLSERIQVLSDLGDYLRQETEFGKKSSAAFTNLITQVERENPWFTSEFTQKAIQAWAKLLDNDLLTTFVAPYQIAQDSSSKKTKTVLLILAGNIPLVGMHDLVCCFLSGEKSLIKLASKDRLLLPFLTSWIIQHCPKAKNYIEYVEGIASEFTHVIATGSDNSARYFEHYFSKYPSIIRKNRSSIGVITPNTTPAELQLLGEDIFTYFGLGCRNVTQLFIPHSFNFELLKESFLGFNYLYNHNKYANNYDYQKAIYLMNQERFYDLGHLLLIEKDKIKSPLGVLYYTYYHEIDEVEQFVTHNHNQIQCVVSDSSCPISHMNFGTAQYPDLWDFADQIDTLHFLLTSTYDEEA